MDTNQQILNLISQVKAMPNSLARNKVISALENARVWSGELPADQAGASQLSECSCDGLGVRRDCPTHGNNVTT